MCFVRRVTSDLYPRAVGPPRSWEDRPALLGSSAFDCPTAVLSNRDSAATVGQDYAARTPQAPSERLEEMGLDRGAHSSVGESQRRLDISASGLCLMFT